MTTLTWISSKAAYKNRIYLKWETFMMKYGKDFRLKPSYFFKKCRYAKVEFYSYKPYKQENNRNLLPLILKAIRKGACQFGTTSLPNISPTTLLKRKKEIASKIIQRVISKCKTHEIYDSSIFIMPKHNCSTDSKANLAGFMDAFEIECWKIESIIVGTLTHKSFTKNIALVSISSLYYK
ncbi:MAG: hypothetical protein CFE22_11275 [Cytophagaceae bacterium BCCC1]|nr:MAG: hypothetical protein CFE22_11275 [Cytophagaceae bacterium BCCC1]